MRGFIWNRQQQYGFVCNTVSPEIFCNTLFCRTKYKGHPIIGNSNFQKFPFDVQVSGIGCALHGTALPYLYDLNKFSM